MPVIFQDRIERTDLRSRPEALFVFGDNEARKGMGGQAAACRGEPNAVGIATKRSPSMAESAFWSEAEFDRCSAIIDRDMEPLFAHVSAGGTVFFPRAGIGTGLSQLPQRAPRLMGHIRMRVRELMRADKISAGDCLTRGA